MVVASIGYESGLAWVMSPEKADEVVEDVAGSGYGSVCDACARDTARNSLAHSMKGSLG